MNTVHGGIDIKEQEIKQRILAAGTEEFHAKGFSGADMRTIAEKAAIAVGTIYNYFPDKASLFMTIVMGEWREFEKEVQEISQNSLSLADKLTEIGKSQLSFIGRHRNVFREIATSPDSKPGVEPSHANLFQPYLLLITQLIQTNAESSIERSLAEKLAALYLSGLIYMPTLLHGQSETDQLGFLVDVITTRISA